jgi:hypothetical protein
MLGLSTTLKFSAANLPFSWTDITKCYRSVTNATNLNVYPTITTTYAVTFPLTVALHGPRELPM